MWVRGYSNDIGTTFILERVHPISIYSSVFYRNEISCPNKSFRIELILIFNPTEILVLVRNLILPSCKLKLGIRSGLKLANRVAYILNPSAFASDSASHWPSCTEELWGRDWYSLGRVTHAYLIWRKNHAGENALGWAGQFYYVNAIRTSHWNETTSVLNVIPVSYKNPLRYLCLWLHSTCNPVIVR